MNNDYKNMKWLVVNGQQIISANLKKKNMVNEMNLF